MPLTELISLIVDQKFEAAQQLTDALRPEIELDQIDFTNSVHRAVQSHVQTDYNVCFIADQFTPEELASFFQDIKKLENKAECVFIQVRDELAEDFDPSNLKQMGFAAVISRRGTHADKAELKEALKDYFHIEEVKARKLNVERSLQYWLKKIDTVASDKKRGRDPKLEKHFAEFFANQTEYDQQVLDKYFDELIALTESAEPQKAFELEVPEDILKKDLPKLERDTYTGASSRVWKKLIGIHGKSSESDSQSEPVAAETTSEPQEGAQTQSKDEQVDGVEALDSSEDIPLGDEDLSESTSQEGAEQPAEQPHKD